MKHARSSLLTLQILAATALISPAALADGSSSTQFTVTGTAPNICVLPSPQTTGTANNASFASNTVTITQFVNPNTALVNASSLSLQFPNTLCNYNATVSMQSKSGGLVSTNASTVASGSGAFLQNVPYTVNASWGSVNLVLDTSTANGSTTTVSAPTNGATAGNMTVTFATAASTLPVPQGTYQDTVTLKIGASM